MKIQPSPRFLRPHKISLFNKKDYELEGDVDYIQTDFNHVTVCAEHSSNSSKNKSEPSDNFVVTIDCNDVPTKYVDFAIWNKEMEGWTVHATDDYIIHKNQELEIVSFKIISPFGDEPSFIELTCQRK